VKVVKAKSAKLQGRRACRTRVSNRPPHILCWLDSPPYPLKDFKTTRFYKILHTTPPQY